MKTVIIAILSIFLFSQLNAQELPKDVEKVYKEAEKLKNKKDYDQAISAYKEVLRSVNHVPSMVSIADIEMTLKPRPNYRNAAEYYQAAIDELGHQINIAPKSKDKKRLSEYRSELEPKRNKAQSYTDDADDAKDNREERKNRLMEDENFD